MPCRQCAQALEEVKPDAQADLDAQVVTLVRKAAEALTDDQPVPLPVAEHEAGHAVVGYLVAGTKLVSIMVRSTGGSTFHESPLEGDPAALRGRVLRAIVGTLAGGAVDDRNGLGWRVHRKDVLAVDRFLATIGHDGGHDTALKPLRTIAAEAVRDAWQTLIAPLAVVLQSEPFLEGEPVIAWLEGSKEAQQLRWFYSRAFPTPTPDTLETDDRDRGHDRQGD